MKKNLGDVLIHFRVNAADFFTACRTFACVCAKPLRKILREETKHPLLKGDERDEDEDESEDGDENARKRQKTEDKKDDEDTKTKKAPTRKTKSPKLNADDSEDLEIAEMKRLEQFLGMDNLRASFAFSKVIATKFEQFCKTHFRVDETLGRAYCRFAWNAFSLTKVKLGTSLFEDEDNEEDGDDKKAKEKPKLMLSSRHKKRKGTYAEKKETIKKEDAERRESNNKKVSSHTTHAGGVPNLYEQFHLLVAIQAFALTNAPETCLRTSLENMLSMTEKDPETGEPLALESLCRSSKTKLASCQKMLKNIEKLHESILKEKNTLRKKYFEKNKKNKTAMENVKLASDIFEREYVEAVREKFGCRAINEKLYVPFLLAEEEIDEEKQREKNLPAPFDVLKGDLREQPIGFARLRAATPMHKKDKSFTFRTGSAVEAAVAVATAATTTAAATNTTNNIGGTFIPPTPQSPYAGFNKTVAGVAVDYNNVQNTPISNVMYGVEWIDRIVSPSSNNVDNTQQNDETLRLLRECIRTKNNDKDKLQDAYARAERMITKCNTLTREDAFTNLNAAAKRGNVSKSLDNIVDNRATDALAVFKYFFRAILRDEINRMEATTTMTTTNANTISDSTKRAISMLVDSKRFVEVVVALSVEVVSVARNGVHLSTSSGIYDVGPSFTGNGGNRAITLRFPAIPNAIGLNAFDVLNGIEPFVRSRPEMPREIRAYFGRIEESMLEKLSWKKDSSLYPLLRVATTKSGAKKKNIGETAAIAAAAAAAAAKSEDNITNNNNNNDNNDIHSNSANQIAAVLLGGTLASGQKVTKPLSKHHTARSLTHMQQFDRNVLGKGGGGRGGDSNDDSPIDEEKKKALDVAQMAHTALRSPPRTTTIIGSGHMSAFSPLKTSAFTAFSTPARRASDNANMGSSSSDVERISGIAHAQQQQYNRAVSSPGVGAKIPLPLPDKYAVDDDDDDDDFEIDDEKRRAKASLDVFFAKVLRLAAVRLADICARLHVNQEVTRRAFQICEFVVFEKTSLLYNRHLDQIILASIYGACKIASSEQDRNVKFKDIVYRYHKQPQCVEEVFWSCPLTVTNPGLEVVSRGDIIAFYNKQFVPNVRPFMLQLRKGGGGGAGGGNSDDALTTKSQKTTTTTTTTTKMTSTPKRPKAAGTTMTAIQSTPNRSRVHFDSEALLKSPIREVKGTAGAGNVYVSPMRPETREKAFVHSNNRGGVHDDENTNAALLHHTFASPARRTAGGGRKSPSDTKTGNIIALVGQSDFHEINETLSQKSKQD